MTTPPRPPIDTPPGDGAAPREKGASTRVPGNLLALGSAAVLTIYGAGYQRTRAAADKFADEADAHSRPSQQLIDAGMGGRGGRGGISAAPTDRAPAALPAPDTRVAAAPPAGTPITQVTRTPPSSANAAAVDASKGAAKSAAMGATDETSASTPATTAPPAPVAVAAPAAPAAPTTPPPAPVSESPKSAPVQPEPEKPRASQWHDGSYTGWGSSRHGDIEATVVIAEGRIVSAQISRCLTRYSCSWIAHLQQQVVVRQSADVDFVSGATQSTNAFYYAVVEALKKAQ